MAEPIKVLLVDARPVVRDGLRTMLGTEPDIVVVGEADDGQAAVQGVSSHHPDVVLMEIHMPKMDGLEATRLIKRQSPHTAVVVFTMYDNATFVVDAVRAGASGYLLEDASRDLILHTIRAVLGAADRTQAPLVARGAEAEESFNEDVDYYRRNLEQLLQKYRGKYIAIVNKAVVDEDVDFSSLAKRVFRRYGYRDIFMPRVTQDEEVVSIPSPRIVRG